MIASSPTNRINVCPYQGSRTIRSEEAVLITLARLRPLLFPIFTEEEKRNMEKMPTIETAASSSVPEIDFSDENPSDESDSGEV